MITVNIFLRQAYEKYRYTQTELIDSNLAPFIGELAREVMRRCASKTDAERRKRRDQTMKPSKRGGCADGQKMMRKKAKVDNGQEKDEK